MKSNNNPLMTKPIKTGILFKRIDKQTLKKGERNSMGRRIKRNFINRLVRKIIKSLVVVIKVKPNLKIFQELSRQ